MDERIDFNIIGRDGGNIFKQCFEPAIQIKDAAKEYAHDSGQSNFSKNTDEQKLALIECLKNLQSKQSLVPAIEDRFFKLVEAGQKYGYDTDSIIEKPNLIGSTVFETATLFSDKICMYILNRNIRVNNILTNFVYPVFPVFLSSVTKCSEIMSHSLVIWEKMLKKGINPKVITGRVYYLFSQIDGLIFTGDAS